MARTPHRTCGALIAMLVCAAAVGVASGDAGTLEARVSSASAQIGSISTGEVGKEWALAEGTSGVVPQGAALDALDELTIIVALAVSGNDGAAFAPDQMLLTLTHASRRRSAVKVIGTAKGTEVSFKLPCALVRKKLGALGGSYYAEVIVADGRMQTPWRARFGPIDVRHAPKANGDPEPEPPLTLLDTPSGAKPEFAHVMREPEGRPPAAVSLFFAAAALCPLALLVFVLPLAGANVRKLVAAGPSAAFFAMLFHAAVLAVLGLLVLYWLSLPLLQMLPLFGALSAAGSILAMKLFASLDKAAPSQGKDKDA